MALCTTKRIRKGKGGEFVGTGLGEERRRRCHQNSFVRGGRRKSAGTLAVHGGWHSSLRCQGSSQQGSSQQEPCIYEQCSSLATASHTYGGGGALQGCLRRRARLLACSRRGAAVQQAFARDCVELPPPLTFLKAAQRHGGALTTGEWSVQVLTSPKLPTPHACQGYHDPSADAADAQGMACSQEHARGMHPA
eukprot:365925-Chlamydomonas_euryale.AAC.17